MSLEDITNKLNIAESNLKCTQRRLNLICSWIQIKFHGDNTLPLSIFNNTTIKTEPLTENELPQNPSSVNSNLALEILPSPIHVRKQNPFIPRIIRSKLHRSRQIRASLSHGLEINHTNGSQPLKTISNAKTNDELNFVGSCSICHLYFSSPVLLEQHKMVHCFVKLEPLPLFPLIFPSTFRVVETKDLKCEKKLSDEKDEDYIPSPEQQSDSEYDELNNDVSDEDYIYQISNENQFDMTSRRMNPSTKKTCDAPSNFFCYHCNYNPLGWTKKQSFVFHLKKHHPTEYKAQVEMGRIKKCTEPKIYHICPICQNKFARPSVLCTHLVSVHTLSNEEANEKAGIGTQKCRHCAKEFPGRTKLLKHVISDHFNSLSELDKEKIKKISSLGDSQTNQANSHKDKTTNPKVKFTPEISLLHSSNSSLKRKRVRSRSNLTPPGSEFRRYKCDYCSSSYEMRKSLENHLHNFHPNEFEKNVEKGRIRTGVGLFLVHTCPNCNIEFTRPKSLLGHLMTVHGECLSEAQIKAGYGTHSCTICNMECKGKGKLLRHKLDYHMGILSEEEREEIHKCTRSYSSLNIKKPFFEYFYDEEIEKEGEVKIKRTYYEHIFTCTTCEKEFYSLNVIMRHLKSIHSYSKNESREIVGFQTLNCNFPNCQVKKRGSLIDFVGPWKLNHHKLKRHFSAMSEEEKAACLKKIRIINSIEMEKESAGFKKTLSKNKRCNMCDKVFINTRSLISHVSQAHRIHRLRKSRIESNKTRDNFRCSYCLCNFFSQKILKSHLYTAHLDQLTESDKKEVDEHLAGIECYTCHDCKLNYRNNKGRYLAHLKLYHSQKYAEEIGNSSSKTEPIVSITPNLIENQSEDDIFKEPLLVDPRKVMVVCDQCGTSISAKGLLAHKKNHLRVRDKKCDFEGCNYSSRTFYDLRRHKEIHSEVRNYKCSYCTFAAKQHASLTIHVHRAHNEDRQPVVCDQCGDSFKTPENMKKHVNSVHENIRPFPCSICDKRFKTKPSLQYHERTHENPNGRKRGLNKERLPRRRAPNKKTRVEETKECDGLEETMNDEAIIGENKDILKVNKEEGYILPNASSSILPSVHYANYNLYY